MYRVSRSDPPSFMREDLSDGSFRMTARTRLTAHPNWESIQPSQLQLLPATAEELFGKDFEKFGWGGKFEKFGWKGKLEVVFAGTRNKNSPLAVLREHDATVIREIYSYLNNQWARHVKITVPAALVGNAFGFSAGMQFNYGRIGNDNSYKRTIMEEGARTTVSSGFGDGFVAFARCGQVTFPKPAGRNVNMMPFIFGDKDSLPGHLQCYFPLIEQCPYMQDDIGQVGYLSVHESHVDVGKAQRREGLHIESPGVFSDDANSPSFTPGVEHPWGMGVFFGPDRYDGGIYMASSVGDTSKVWDALVDSRVPGIVDHHGGCEHLRSLIGGGTKLEAGELIWMTDCTPHEALPQKQSGPRQFFRVVTPAVSHWFADHSTENPRVHLPSHVTVVHGNKLTRSL